MARRFPLPSFLSTKRSRAITITATLTAATAISLLSTLPPSSSPVPAAYTTTSQHAAAQPAANGVAQGKLAARKAAAAKASAAKAAAAKTAAARASAAKAAKRAAARRSAVTTQSGSPEQVAERMLSQFGWSSSQFSCLQPLWEHESGWDLTAENSSSGAYGIPQALPGSRMASAGADWQTDAATQIRWGLTYIQGRYGSPCGAWAHEETNNWY